MRDDKRKKPFAKKSFGQNFLVDPNYVNKIISALSPREDESIIEIGAGRGALTEKLIGSGANVLAIELDEDLIPVLTEHFGRFENFTLIENDALKIDFSALEHQSTTRKSKLVANLPYYISTAILQHLTQYRDSFSQLVLMLQREVVHRITAEAGNTERGFLTVLIEAYFTTQKLFDVPPNAFRPAPKIWSSVIRLEPKHEIYENEEFFKTLVSEGFQHKRKTIFNNLKNSGKILYNKDLKEVLEENRIDPRRRAETLTLDEWKRLALGLNEKND